MTVNIVSQERPKNEAGKRQSKLVIWLIVLGMGLLMLPLYLIASIIETANMTMADELAVIEQDLAVTPAPDPTETALRDNLLLLQTDNNTLEAQINQLESSYFNLPTLINAIRTYDSQQMQLLALVQTDTRLTLTGRGGDEGIITTYVESLRASERFSTVMILSLTLKSDSESKSAAAQLENSEEAVVNYIEFVILAEIQVSQP